MAKSPVIKTTSGQKFKGPGWDQKVKPFKQPEPRKWDPKRGNTGISNP